MLLRKDLKIELKSEIPDQIAGRQMYAYAPVSPLARTICRARDFPPGVVRCKEIACF